MDSFEATLTAASSVALVACPLLAILAAFLAIGRVRRRSRAGLVHYAATRSMALAPSGDGVVLAGKRDGIDVMIETFKVKAGGSPQERMRIRAGLPGEQPYSVVQSRALEPRIDGAGGLRERPTGDGTFDQTCRVYSAADRIPWLDGRRREAILRLATRAGAGTPIPPTVRVAGSEVSLTFASLVWDEDVLDDASELVAGLCAGRDTEDTE